MQRIFDHVYQRQVDRRTRQRVTASSVPRPTQMLDTELARMHYFLVME